jgi:hypothetical protein
MAGGGRVDLGIVAPRLHGSPEYLFIGPLRLDLKRSSFKDALRKSFILREMRQTERSPATSGSKPGDLEEVRYPTRQGPAKREEKSSCLTQVKCNRRIVIYTSLGVSTRPPERGVQPERGRELSGRARLGLPNPVPGHAGTPAERE